MRREILLERIDKLKQLMPWYVLEYYQSKLAVPYSFTTLYEYLKEYDRFFTWVLESGISDADSMANIPLSVLENLTKKDLESSLYALIADASGSRPAKAVEVYEAINLDAKEARALGMSTGAAALRTLRTTYDAHGKPFEASVIISRADRNRFQVTLDTSGTTFSKVIS